MDLRSFLTQHAEISHAIDAKIEQVEELKSLATKATVGTPHESRGSGGYSDKVGRTVVKIVDLENEINAEIDRLIESKMKIRELIALLPDMTHRTLMERHYILHESWERIAEKMGYTSRHIARLHNQALEYLEPLYAKSDLSV